MTTISNNHYYSIDCVLREVNCAKNLSRALQKLFEFIHWCTHLVLHHREISIITATLANPRHESRRKMMRKKRIPAVLEKYIWARHKENGVIWIYIKKTASSYQRSCLTGKNQHMCIEKIRATFFLRAKHWEYLER